jgi:hypothetical protein
MAKEQWHRWGQTVVTILTLAFVCGLTYSRIEVNTDDINDNKTDIGIVETDVHRLQVNQQMEIALKQSLLRALTRLESKVDKITTDQTQIKIDVNSTKVKIDTLTKD